MSLKRFLRNHCPSVLAWILFYKDIKRRYINPYVKIRANKDRCHESVIFELPVDISDYSLIKIDPYTNIRKNFTFLGVEGKFHLKKYSTIAMNCTVVTDGHIPTVGLPHIISGTYHINDKCRDITVHEAVWIGVNCTLLPGAEIGRGAIIGAGSIVNKKIPPYAIAVGCPAKVIASAFTIEQIIEHEKALYPEQERMSREQLEELFNQYYNGKKSIGIAGIPDNQKTDCNDMLVRMRKVVDYCSIKE